MNSGFLITDAGLAAATVSNPLGPFIHIAQFRVGSAVNYTPTRSMTGLQGTTLHTGVPNGYTVVDVDTVEILLTMNPTVGTFEFGEIGLYLQTGELFALCVFDILQQQVRAVGSQAGSVWRIRARLRLAQASSLVQVTLINSQSILEVPSWLALAAPVNQLNAANIAIVHEDSSNGQPITVVRNNDLEWALLDYARLFIGATTDGGITSLTATSFTHSNISQVYVEDSPRTDSRYAIKFPDGSVRRVTSVVGNSISWAGGVNPAQVGQITVWEYSGGGQRISWADTQEYNNFVSQFNLYWGNPIGPLREVGASRVAYPAVNRGKGQTAFAALTRRTVPADWQALVTAVRNNCTIHGIPITDIQDVTDFVYRPTAPNFPGLQTLQVQWEALQAKLPLLESNRNVFTNAFDQITLGNLESTGFWNGPRGWEFTLDFGTAAVLQAHLNSGYQIAGSLDWTAGSNSLWNSTLDDVEAALSSFTLRTGSAVMSSVGFTNTGGLSSTVHVGVASRVILSQDLLFGPSGQWQLRVSVISRLPGQLTVIVTLINGLSSVGSYDYEGNDGTLNITLFSQRNHASLLTNPVLAHPTLTSAVLVNTANFIL